MSIMHRLTGVALALAAILIVWWFAALATGPAYFDFVNGVMTSWLGLLVLTGLLWAFWYHFFNGIRHLRWDTGAGLGLGEAMRSGWAVIVLSVVMTIVTLVLAV